MREIKFRAWMKSPGVMVYESDMWGDEQFLGVLDGCAYFKWEHGSEDYPETDYDLVEAEIMQYTGQKDINSKEIYEGDICRIWTFPHFGAKERFPTKKTKVIAWHTNRPAFNFHSGEGLEVIGNIYKNSELLADTKGNNAVKPPTSSQETAHSSKLLGGLKRRE